MNLFLTGVNGFLGSHMARHWAGLGHAVSGADLPESRARAGSELRRFTPFVLGGPLDAEALAGIDAIVHLAYDRDAGFARNVEGAKLACAAASGAGVRRQIYVSSYSARPDALSEYGRLKHEIESHFLDRGHTVVRPGLVVGNGGLFGRNMRKILNTPVMPLLDGGADLLPVVAMDDLLAAMTGVLERPAGAYNLFHPDPVSMRRFIETVNRAGRHRAVYFNIPAIWAERALRCAEKCGVRLPVDRDNLRALKQNQRCIHASDLAALAPRSLSFEEAVAAAVEDWRRSRAR